MKRSIAIISSCLMVLFSLSACLAGSRKNDLGSDTIKVAGSTSIAPLMRAFESEYESLKSVNIEIQESGSSTGVSAAISGASDIGMSSRSLADEELNSGFESQIIALDGIALIVNHENPVDNLSKEEISSIFKGEIRNWSELGGDNAEIIVISREDGSGTRRMFEESLNLQNTVIKNGKTLHGSLLYKKALYENSTGGIKKSVVGSRSAIGYISLGTLDDSVKPLSIDGVSSSAENVRNGSYFLAHPFVIVYAGDNSDAVNDFVAYMLSDDGQDIVESERFVRID